MNNQIEQMFIGILGKYQLKLVVICINWNDSL